MKKPVKILLWLLAIVAILIILAVASLPLILGPTVRSVATSVVPQLTGTEFQMDSCSINPYTGKLSINGFALKNPKGYDEPNAVSFESLNVAVEVGSLLTKKIHVYEIVLEKPFASYVFDDEGTNNFDRILANVNSKLKKDEKKEEKVEKKEEAGEAPKVLIDKLVINGTKVKYRKLSLPIPLPNLTKIGYGTGDDKAKEEAKGATLEEVRDQIWKEAKSSVPDLGNIVGGATDAVKNVAGAAAGVVTGAASTVTDAAGKVGEGAANALKGAANLVGAGDAAAKTGEVATKTVDAAKETAAKAGEAAKDAAAKAAEATTGAVKDGAKAVGEGLKKLNPFGK